MYARTRLLELEVTLIFKASAFCGTKTLFLSLSLSLTLSLYLSFYLLPESSYEMYARQSSHEKREEIDPKNIGSLRSLRWYNDPLF
jgi:hypothetical protein